MASFTAQGITEAGIADDRTSVRISFQATPEPVTLSIDWRLASELIDRIADINNGIRRELSAPDRRAIRIRTGCHRAGIGLVALLLMGVAWGLWRWTQGVLDTEGWVVIAGLALAAPTAYCALWLIGWIVAGFIGSRDQGPA